MSSDSEQLRDQRQEVCVCGHPREDHRTSEAALMPGECTICGDMECLGYIKHWPADEVARTRREMFTGYPR